jgi:hypothetical protein
MRRYGLRDDQWTGSSTCCPAGKVRSGSPPPITAGALRGQRFDEMALAAADPA